MHRTANTLLLGLFLVAPFAHAVEPYRPRKTGHPFPIYTNNPPGNMLENDPVRRGAKEPALHPEETRKLIHVPPGFEVRLFASEPEVVNPVGMTWDERGRLWVVELYEYPKGAPKGAKGRDRIKILEDTDADGKADKVTVFADGFSLATGIALGHGGVYLGAAPDLLFLEDTDGDDKADKTTKLLTGFGMEDRHELLNGFAWGPDGWLYMTHGVFTHSKVRGAHDPDGFGVQMDAALARFHPRTKKFEVFADGTSNPWGVDWNERGDAFVSACVIQHLFHLAPGGLYNRQGGTWANPYGYVGDLPTKGLPAIVDWRHYRAAHAGICIYQGDQYPPEWRGLVMLGNIHQNALNCDRLTPVGATYKAEKESKLLGPDKGIGAVGAGNFLVSKDPWFRPISVQTGPDGALWVADWSDKYPCYQNAQADPLGVDREMGRIWRVVWTGDQPGKKIPSRLDAKMDFKKASDEQLAKLLAHPNNWQRRQAQRLLGERAAAVNKPTSLTELWAAHATGQAMEPALDQAAAATAPWHRAWAARLTGEVSEERSGALPRLAALARDEDPSVRAAAAVALRKFSSGSFTVGTVPAVHVGTATLLPHFRELLARPSGPGDTYYPHIVWMAMEPRAAQDPQPFLKLFAETDTSVSAYCLYRTMRRICDLTDAAERERHLNAAMEFLGAIADKIQLVGAALDGLIKAQEAKGARPTAPFASILAKLITNPALADKARRLAALLGDSSAARTLLAKINDPKASVDDRLKGIQSAREAKSDAARGELVKLLGTEKNQTLLVETVRALGGFPGDDIAYTMTDAWKHFSAGTRRDAAEVLVTRVKWARALLAGVEKKLVAPQDISATARRALAQSTDSTVVDQADRFLGRYRATGGDKLKLIAEKRSLIFAAAPDLKNGHEVAKKSCFVCHKLYTDGADVGPDLTGVGRSTLDALLHNVIDPNEVIGNGNEATEVELKDGTVLTGRVVEDAPTRLKLLAAGPTEHVIAKSDIAVKDGKPKIRTLHSSLMPEGLEQMPDKDFRDLIWFLLNPPQDNRPWTPALRKELLGDETAGLPKKPTK
ncbi:MAG: dehydrogenase [Pedosphaera sp.]|nr:dehydrogenase [Pedosphaera sp.]